MCAEEDHIMSSIGQVNNSLIQSQMNSLQLGNKISTAVAVKAMDAAKMEGAAMLSLLEGAAEMAQNPQAQTGDVGQNLDITA
jgi:hypothetical protein